MKNWKTTVMGWLAGALLLVGGAMENRAANPNAPAVTFHNLFAAAAVAALGSVAKDHDK